MNRMALEVRVVLLQLHALRGVLLVLLRRVPAHAGHARLTLLGALEMDDRASDVSLLGHGGLPKTIRMPHATRRAARPGALNGPVRRCQRSGGWPAASSDLGRRVWSGPGMRAPLPRCLVRIFAIVLFAGCVQGPD